MNIAPQTLAADIVSELNVLQALGKHLDKQSFPWTKLKRAAEKLIHADAAEGWAALGLVHSIAGDIAEVDRCFGNSLKLRPDVNIRANMLASYAKLGFCTISVNMYSEIGSPEHGVFSHVFSFGMYRGAFQSAVHNIALARKMELDMADFAVEIAEKSAIILQRAGLSDESVARHLDAAGAVLREKCMFEVRQPEIIATDVENVLSGVTMVLYLKCDPEEIFSYNVALAQKEEELNVVKHPAFDVVFATTETIA